MSEARHASLGIHHTAAAPKGPHRVMRKRMLKRAIVYALGFIALLLVGAAVIVARRSAHAHTLAENATQSALLYVSVVSPRPANGNGRVELPGTLQGFVEAPIYARASGYLSKWYKDIGDHVTKGELLAQIEAPEVQQQLAEATAAQATAATNLELARSSFERWTNLRKRDAVSQQEFDERSNTLKQTQANLDGSSANVRRLQELVGYSKVVAPFTGVVTKRNVDVGNLIDPGGGARLLFTMAQIDPLRVYIYVPQTYASQIQVGSPATVTLTEMPGRAFVGKVVRTAGAIDPANRTMQVEVNLPNPDGKLFPGSYVQVQLQTDQSDVRELVIPNNALLFRAEGPMVVAVGADNHVHLRPVTIARELGGQVVLNAGVSRSDRLVVNPPDSLAENDPVTVAAPTPSKGASDKGAADKGKAEGSAPSGGEGA
jgi:RND family efflux transporter MFP subunit